MNRFFCPQLQAGAVPRESAALLAASLLFVVPVSPTTTTHQVETIALGSSLTRCQHRSSVSETRSSLAPFWDVLRGRPRLRVRHV